MNNDTYAERIRGLEELLVEATVNMVERRSLDGDIFKLAEDHKQLLAENDSLRAQLLQAPDAKMVAFVAAFELWLQSHILTEDDGDDYWVISPTEHSTHEDVRRQWRMLKAQHLGDDSKTS